LHISAKFQGVFDHNRKQLTEKFDGGGKLINVMQFQGGNWNFVNFRGVIDETYNFRGEIAYLLIFFVLQTQMIHQLLHKARRILNLLKRELTNSWVIHQLLHKTSRYQAYQKDISCTLLIRKYLPCM